MDDTSVMVFNDKGTSQLALVCEHDSNHIPACYGGPGPSEEAALSHAAWDPGAYGATRKLSEILDVHLVTSTMSRSVYDCNLQSVILVGKCYP